jgi:hypothetical protein
MPDQMNMIPMTAFPDTRSHSRATSPIKASNPSDANAALNDRNMTT